MKVSVKVFIAFSVLILRFYHVRKIETGPNLYGKIDVAQWIISVFGKKRKCLFPAFLAGLFLEKTLGIAVALMLASCKNFDILDYLCYY